MPNPWNDDPPGSLPLIQSNIVALGPTLKADAASRRVPTIAMAQDWHRAIYAGITLPEPYYAGEIRDSDPSFPELYGYEVAVGAHMGVLSQNVPAELTQLESRIQDACSRLDAAIPVVGAQPPDDPTLSAVVFVCANVHGEWVRIHPFANGNGRTARVWANWLALRYGLPPFVSVKPRPAGLLYGFAAEASMKGNHSVVIALFEQMLRSQLNQP